MKENTCQIHKNLILNQYHLALGHGTVANMTFSISKKYKWPKMHDDIKRHYQNCLTCLKSGEEIINTKNNVINTTRPHEMWEIDIIGYFRESQRGYKFILVAIDHYSKWVETKAIKTKDMKTVIEAIKELIIEKHGIPEKIYTDNGLEFNNSLAQEFTAEFGVKWIRNSPGHHNAIGAVERVNQTLVNKLKKLCEYGRLDWANSLEKATNATNMSYNRSIKTSPYILKYAKYPDLEIDKIMGKTEIKCSKAAIIQARDDNFANYSRKYIEKGKRKAKDDFQEGDKVLLFREVLGNKLASHWTEGYTVEEILSSESYIVSKDGKRMRAHKTHLKRDTSVLEGECRR